MRGHLSSRRGDSGREVAGLRSLARVGGEQQRAEEQETGWKVGRRIRDLVEARVGEVMSENVRMQIQVECYEAVAAVMKDAGISDHNTFNAKYAAQRQLVGMVTADLLAPLNGAKRSIERAIEKLAPQIEELES